MGADWGELLWQEDSRGHWCDSLVHLSHPKDLGLSSVFAIREGAQKGFLFGEGRQSHELWEWPCHGEFGVTAATEEKCSRPLVTEFLFKYFLSLREKGNPSVYRMQRATPYTKVLQYCYIVGPSHTKALRTTFGLALEPSWRIIPVLSINLNMGTYTEGISPFISKPCPLDFCVISEFIIYSAILRISVICVSSPPALNLHLFSCQVQKNFTYLLHILLSQSCNPIDQSKSIY